MDIEKRLSETKETFDWRKQFSHQKSILHYLKSTSCITNLFVSKMRRYYKACTVADLLSFVSCKISGETVETI